MAPHKTFHRLICVATGFALLVPLALPPFAAAADKVLLVEQAQAMAVSSSRAISKKTNEITLQKIKYVESVAKIKAKIKNITTFRWSPLLSFKFPQGLNMSEEYDLNIKPITLQADIATMQHELNDLRYAALLEASKNYSQAYVLQEKCAFTESRLELAKEELERNRLRQRSGGATQSDIEKMEKSVDTLEKDLANQKRSFESAKKTLSETIGIDVTTGYKFKNGLYTAAVPREKLQEIIQYTVDNDHEYYVAKMETSTALLNLNSYEGLMRGKYGDKLNRVMPFVNAVKQGQDVDYAAFQLKYREMVTDIDSPWYGYWRILFFKFAKERLKGELSGTRYIEDDLYALYTSCMEYANAKKSQESAEKSLRRDVEVSFETLVSAENAYRAMSENVANQKASYEKLLAGNRMGRITYEEVSGKLEDYQTAQVDELDLLSAYNELLFEFDRLTCGAVTKYFRGESLTSDSGESADSFSNISTPDGAYYHINTSIADMVFTFGIEIPEDYEPQVTAFELWYDGQQIGGRTQAGKELRHLALDYKETSALTVKLFDGDNYVGECEIDTRVPRDTLDFFSSSGEDEDAKEQVGSYTMSISTVGDMKIAELMLKINASEGVSFYRLTYDDGRPVGSDQLMKMDEPFRYLSMLVPSLEDVVLVMYDENRNELFKAHMSESGRSVWRDAAG